MSGMVIYLVRHGLSVWNGEKRVTGQCDPALADEGRAQAARLHTALSAEPLHAIFTSTRQRSVATAEPLAAARALVIQRLEDLNEQHFGVLEGRYRDARDPEAQRLWQARQAADEDYALPGGESFAALRARVSRALTTILAAAAHGPVLIVGHRHTNRALLCALLGWSHEQARGAQIRHHYIHRIECGPPRRVSSISLRERDTGRVRPGLWL